MSDRPTTRRASPPPRPVAVACLSRPVAVACLSRPVAVACLSRPVAVACLSRALLVLVAVAIVMALAGDALACPTCKDGVAEADPEGANIARGYFYSILLMLGMPFTLAGSFGIYVWREMRRQERERLRTGAAAPAALATLPPTGGVARGA